MKQLRRPLTFIGFSGCGKSHLAREFAARLGFRHLECDALIEQKLLASLPAPVGGHAPSGSGLTGTARVADWLGQPYDVGFPGRQQRYFFAEQETLAQFVELIEAADASGDVDASRTVLDTTGSVIYVERSLLDRIKQLTTVVYFRMSESDEQAMFEQYLRDPKPVLWQNVFRELPGESREDALRRCYPQLIAHRTALYEALAQIVIPWSLAERERITPEALLELIAVEEVG